MGEKRRNNEISLDIEVFCMMSTGSAQRVVGVHMYVAFDTYDWYKLRAISLRLRFRVRLMRTIGKKNWVQFYTILP